MAVKTRAPTDPTETRDDPLCGGAEVSTGGDVGLAEVELAGALALELATELDSTALLLGAGAVVAGADGAGADGAGADGAGDSGVGLAGGAGAVPGGVT